MLQRNYSLMTAILFWSGLAVMSNLYVAIPLNVLFADYFKITLSQASSIGSGYAFGFACGCLIFGPLSEKYGRKNIIVIGMLSISLLSLPIGLVQNFTWISVMRSLQGLAAATFSPVALAYAVEMFPISKRVTAIGFISTGFLSAGIVGQVLSSLLSQQYNWQAVFYVLAAIYAVTLILIIKLLPNDENRNQNLKFWDPFKRIPLLITKKTWYGAISSHSYF